MKLSRSKKLTNGEIWQLATRYREEHGVGSFSSPEYREWIAAEEQKVLDARKAKRK